MKGLEKVRKRSGKLKKKSGKLSKKSGKIGQLDLWQPCTMLGFEILVVSVVIQLLTT